MVVGEILLSAFFNVLFERLASRDLLNFLRQLQGGVDFELRKWQDSLIMIQALLSDAEEKELTDGAVKFWLDDLRDLAYDAEDILDEFDNEALKFNLMGEYDEDRSRKVQNLIPTCVSCFNPSTAKCNLSMDSKIKNITNRFEELCAKRIALGLQLIPGGTSTAAQQRQPSSSVPTERAVYGRDEDKANILKLVLSDEPSDANFRVIPIVGMAGVGKTTLAREVYNDKSVEDFKFDIKAWIGVSDDFDVLSISRALLESITSEPCDLKTLNEVQVQLKKAVDGKRFLLVLDDVWNEDYSSWEILKSPFMAGASQSKIIVTTRHANVASTMGTAEHYNLKHLSDEDCWSVFTKHAFEGKSINAHQISELFYKKVVAKCGGLPLAASTLGGLLRSKKDDAWEDILNSNIWDLPQQSGIHPVLRLSYHHLPSHLKRCFAYCALFPKDYEFTEKELVFLWMAEGVIQKSNRNNKQLEDWGSECFQDLVSRSIFLQSTADRSKFVMHDLVHDLAQLVSGETIFRLEEPHKHFRRFKRVRHFSYIRGEFDGKNKFEVFYEVEQLRTFLPVLIRGRMNRTSYISPEILPDLLQKFKRLRVLSLVGYHITQLPSSVKDLRLLRYLNLAGTMIRSLPEATCSLLNLQILILRDCSRLIKLPSKMRNLMKLRHLDIQGATLLEEMPIGMKQLKNLQTLSNFIVGKGRDVSGLKDLKYLKFLCGELCISGLENVNDPRKAREAMLCEKKSLEALSLQWECQLDGSRDEATEENVLDMLQPHKNIKELTIRHYGGARFPFWITDSSFSDLSTLELRFCENCRSIPSLGLLGSLKNLTIQGMSKLRGIGSELYGEGCLKPFELLETLRFENLEEWEYWDNNIEENEQVKIFPHLRELYIMECPKLCGKLPELLPSLETLVVSKCEELVVSFSGYPMLCKLEIDECNGLVCSAPVDTKLIKSVTISNSTLDIHGCRGMLYSSPSELFNFVTITNILEYANFLKQGFQIVDTLATGSSERIKSWRQYGFFQFRKPIQGLHMLTYPEEISIEENCISLVSFPEVNFLPNNLRSLKIQNNRTLISLPEEMMGNNTQLEMLFISHCESLTFIARSKLPSSLKRLEIWYCENLKNLIDEDAFSPDCLSFTPSSSGTQGIQALEFLIVGDCPKLESLPDGLHNLSCLRYISIRNCPSLVSFPKRGLPNSISSVSIERCEKLEALPNNMNKVNSIDYLEIRKCPKIISFPEEGFPTNLKSLHIEDLKIYRALMQWGLHRLTSLTCLDIDGCDNAESFPDEEMGIMLPTSLAKLTISGFQKLKYLSSMGFQCLTSLEQLWIFNCPKLSSFPQLGLPSSLLQLHIYDCPLLEKHCKRDKGKEWSKISHIPCVMIDHAFIYD
ncbi:Disease resistance protein [Melia azedarach]|uniref:Disease resistance protein n=1 Tax=Melia azedarach TaxID=155640 RepID=A0ACC1YLL3_MELAZ|nr:Disease resistance protein [Melia azedarach]